jgi:hypothetical protein
MFCYSAVFRVQNFLMLMRTLGASDPKVRQMLGPVLNQIMCHKKFHKVNKECTVLYRSGITAIFFLFR